MSLEPRHAGARTTLNPWARWHSWRQSRPLPAALLTFLAGLALLTLPAGSISVVLLPGLAGSSGFLFGAGLCALAGFLALQPRSHAFAGVAAVIIAITSSITTNLGGFGVGLALGVLGGALGFAWTPQTHTDVELATTPGRTDDGPTRPIPSSGPTDLRRRRT